MSMFNDMFNAGKDLINQDFVSDDEAVHRLAICEACEHYWSITTQCSLCGCIMPIKTKLMHVECPNDPPKW